MKNFKMGFSMLVAILVLSIGTIAMAAKPAATTGVGIKPLDADSIQVSPGAVGAVYSAGSTTAAESGWDITLKENVGADTDTSNDLTVGTKTIATTANYVEFDGLTEGSTYYIVSVAKGTAGDVANGYTTEDFKFHFDGLYNPNQPEDQEYVVDIKDNNVANANGTGVNGMAKGISGHKTHGDYKNNTNSCASCHQTHTAAGKNLLFKETAEEACVACHDGTGMTIYNVFPTLMTKDNGGGTFAGTEGGNMSVHLTDESVHLAAAPGSNMKITGANWGGEFSCDTCHNPHGSYSSRLLQTNTAGFMNVARTYVGGTAGTTTFVAPKQWYGGLFATVSVVDLTAQTVQNFGAAAKSPVGDFSVAGVANNSVFAQTITLNKGVAGKEKDGIVSALPGDNITLTGDTSTGAQAQDTTTSTFSVWDPSKALQPGKELFLIKYLVTTDDVAVGGYYEKTGLTPGAKVWQFIRKMDGANFYQRIPFSTISNNKPDFTLAGANLTINSLNNVKGYFVLGATGNVTGVTNFKAFQIVRLPQEVSGPTVNGVTEMRTPWNKFTSADGKSGLVTSASTVAYAQYCGTCHVDYASASGIATDLDNGQKAYHHTANSTSAGRSCAFCHYAHGTDVTFMRDAVGNTVASLQTTGDISQPGSPTMDETAAIAYMKDKNPSSALKRYTNMSVCYGCHVSSHYAGLGNNGSTGVGSSLGLDNNGLPKAGTWK